MKNDSYTEKTVTTLADQLFVLGNANRLAILKNLADGEIQVNVLATKLGLGQSALSQHLAILRSCEFVSQSVFYSIRPTAIASALAGVKDLLFSQPAAIKTERVAVSNH
jgi:DNA-binding transcriptional ArsR family regulator